MICLLNGTGRCNATISGDSARIVPRLWRSCQWQGSEQAIAKVPPAGQGVAAVQTGRIITVRAGGCRRLENRLQKTRNGDWFSSGDCAELNARMGAGSIARLLHEYAWGVAEADDSHIAYRCLWFAVSARPLSASTNVFAAPCSGLREMLALPPACGASLGRVSRPGPVNMIWEGQHAVGMLALSGDLTCVLVRCRHPTRC